MVKLARLVGSPMIVTIMSSMDIIVILIVTGNLPCEISDKNASSGCS